MVGPMRNGVWMPWLVAVGVLLLMWGPFFLTVVHDLPFGSHSWKQGDCFAIAQRYLEDGNWNILAPRTQSLIPTDGRVNAELPVVPYLAAVGARLVGKDHLVEIFRVLSLLLTSLAPIGIFGFVWGRTRTLPEALFAMVFVASCPILVYYGTGFHPDPEAFGPLMLGLTLVLGWRSPAVGEHRAEIAGLGLMTLAGLMKMSMAPYLLVPAVLLVHRSERRNPGAGALVVLREIPRGPLLALAAGGGLLAAQFVALKILAWGYAPTFFTASPHPFRSLDHLVSVVQRAWRVWLKSLFTAPQLWVLALALGFSVIRVFRRRRADELAMSIAAAIAVMWGLFVLFGKQYAWHDYYAIATFYPVAALLVARLARELHWRPASGAGRMVRVVAVLVMLGVTFSMAQAVRPLLERRTTRWYRLQVGWMDQGKDLLEACGSRCAGPVAVLGSKPPNLALTHLDRQGYVLGVGLRDGLGVPYFGSLSRLVAYLDARQVSVLVVRRAALEALPERQVAGYFQPVEEGKDVVVLVRKAIPRDGRETARGSDNRRERNDRAQSIN